MKLEIFQVTRRPTMAKFSLVRTTSSVVAIAFMVFATILIYNILLIKEGVATDAISTPWRSTLAIFLRCAACLVAAIAIATTTTLYCNIFKPLTLEQAFLRVRIGIMLSVVINIIMAGAGVLLDDAGKFQYVDQLYNNGIIITLAMVSFFMLMLLGMDLTSSETVTTRTIIDDGGAFQPKEPPKWDAPGTTGEQTGGTSSDTSATLFAHPDWQNLLWPNAAGFADESAIPVPNEGGTSTATSPETSWAEKKNLTPMPSGPPSPPPSSSSPQSSAPA